jgi:hypothetical protein
LPTDPDWEPGGRFCVSSAGGLEIDHSEAYGQPFDMTPMPHPKRNRARGE